MPDVDKHLLCPYCGDVQPAAPRCRVCGGLFEPLSRDATQTTMGPWFVRDPQQPFLPGCSYEVIVRRAQAGRITPDSIVRGPTTRQWWTFARHTPGLAHLLGLCHRCGQTVDPLGAACGACGTAFIRPTQRNELGLQYPTPQAAADAARQIREKRQRLEEAAAQAAAHAAPRTNDQTSTEHPSDTTDRADNATGGWRRPAAPTVVKSAAGTLDHMPMTTPDGHLLAAAVTSVDRASTGGNRYALQHIVAALSPPDALPSVAESQASAARAGIQHTGRGMRVQAPGQSVAHGLWMSMAIAAGILVAGILLLVVTHR